MAAKVTTEAPVEGAPSFQQELATWSLDRAKWQRHALWKLATNAELTDPIFEELVGALKREHGLAKAAEEEETLFEASHLAAPSTADLKLLSVGEIANVNRLDPAGLSFAPAGLTIIYGDNGSGKTGFIRVLRKACRSRIEKPQDLEILANVYGAVGGAPAAKFTLSNGGKEETIDWKDGDALDPRLASFSVFDSRSAQLYVDEGNKLRYLPGDLDLPFRLNEVIRRVEEQLVPEVQAVEKLLGAYVVPFDPGERDSTARKFASGLSADVTDEEIDGACAFTADDATELEQLRKALSSGPERIAELRQLASSAETLASKVDGIVRTLGEEAAANVTKHWQAVVSAREAHEVTKLLVAGKDPLEGVGSETWARMWKAAQAFAEEADEHHHFPGSGPVGAAGEVVCPLCQQQVASATERFERFEQFISSATANELEKARLALDGVTKPLKELSTSLSPAEDVLVASVRGANEDVATGFGKLLSEADVIRKGWLAYTGAGDLSFIVKGDLWDRLTNVATEAKTQAERVTAAQDLAQRAKLQAELGELVDQQCLSKSANTLKERRNALKTKRSLLAAQASCRRNEVTRQANKWVDVHLTGEAKKTFNAHLAKLKLGHLNVDIERQSSSVGTGFKNAIQGAKGFRRVSDVLSEGEQRALSLAAFLTEAKIERPGATLIVDDPVSSLDRERSALVAEQLIDESKGRQVIVFTHDLMFLEELGEASKRANVEPTVKRVFSTPEKAGLHDPMGSPWKGQNVKQRIAVLREMLKAISALETTSPGQYEIEVKGFYGRLRDAYERLVEEKLFHNVVTRFRSAIKTMELRYVTVPDDLAKRFHAAFSKASTHCHLNPPASAGPPGAAEIAADLDAFDQLAADIDAAQKAALNARAEMAP